MSECGGNAQAPSKTPKIFPLAIARFRKIEASLLHSTTPGTDGWGPSLSGECGCGDGIGGGGESGGGERSQAGLKRQEGITKGKMSHGA